MNKQKIIIAIDPDVDKNGVAYFNCKTKQLEASALTFPQLLDYLRYAKRQAEVSEADYIVIIEAGWLINGNWHLHPKDTKKVAAAKGKHVGRNHEVGRKIEEMCKHWGIHYKLVKPLPKMWRGPDKKITKDELNEQLKHRGIQPIIGRTNQEMRDAVLLCIAEL